MADEQGEEVSVVMDDKSSKKAGISQQSNKVCFFYARSKSCKFGEKCRFVHLEGKVKYLEDTSGKSPRDLDVEKTGKMNEDENQIEFSGRVSSSTEKNKRDSEKIADKSSNSLDLESTQTTPREQEFQKDDDLTTEKQELKEEEESKINSKKRCRFFLSKSGCARGSACNFSHTKTKIQRKPKNDPQEKSIKTNDNENDKKETKNTIDELKSSTLQNKRSALTKVVSTATKLSMLEENELKNLRSRELNQVVRGFGKLGLKTLQDEVDETTYQINFSPSDPDWPFDVEIILLLVNFPGDYPKTMFQASLSEEQDLPLELIRFTNKGIGKWLEEQQKARNSKDTVDLPFRPFLRWLDRNMEKLFIEAAKEMKEREEARAYDEESIESNESADEDGNCSPEEIGTKEYGKVKTGSDVENIDPNKIKDEEKDGSGKEMRTKPKQKRRTKDSHSYTTSERKELLLSDFLTFTKPNKNKGNKGAVTSKGSLGDSTQKEEKRNSHIVFVDQDSDLSLQKDIAGGCDKDQILEKARKSDDDDDDIHLESGYDKGNDELSLQLKRNQEARNDQHRGTEIRFKSLELSENAAILTTDCVALTMECLKCKAKIDVKVDKTRSSAIRCVKCSSVLRISFRPSVIHQYSSTLGYLDLEGWHPFDLNMTEIQLIAGCLACSNDTNIKGPHYGTNQVWCNKCHQKLSFSVESTRFFELTPTSVQDKDDSSIEKPKKKPKVPGLREGFPLPDNGTCKHYKKSFRWLRFPCCGKCFPCDICHEEQEDHEFKFANRMVCGFCSKEQPYSQGNCIACGSFTTKAKTSHWEGGKGCRNKTIMSKGDDRKFKNTMKTTSRKAQAKEAPKAKAK